MGIKYIYDFQLITAEVYFSSSRTFECTDVPLFTMEIGNNLMVTLKSTAFHLALEKKTHVVITSTV